MAVEFLAPFQLQFIKLKNVWLLWEAINSSCYGASDKAGTVLQRRTCISSKEKAEVKRVTKALRTTRKKSSPKELDVGSDRKFM